MKVALSLLAMLTLSTNALRNLRTCHPSVNAHISALLQPSNTSVIFGQLYNLTISDETARELALHSALISDKFIIPYTISRFRQDDGSYSLICARMENILHPRSFRWKDRLGKRTNLIVARLSTEADCTSHEVFCMFVNPEDYKTECLIDVLKSRPELFPEPEYMTRYFERKMFGGGRFRSCLLRRSLFRFSDFWSLTPKGNLFDDNSRTLLAISGLIVFTWLLLPNLFCFRPIVILLREVVQSDGGDVDGQREQRQQEERLLWQAEHEARLKAKIAARLLKAEEEIAAEYAAQIKAEAEAESEEEEEEVVNERVEEEQQSNKMVCVVTIETAPEEREQEDVVPEVGVIEAPRGVDLQPVEEQVHIQMDA